MSGLFRVTHADTGIIISCFLGDATATKLTGKTGLTHATSGLSISTRAQGEATETVYTSAGSTIETITTLGTYQAPTATKCRFKEQEDGFYEIHLANTRYAVSGATHLRVAVTGVADTDDAVFFVDLPAFDLDATDANLNNVSQADIRTAVGLASANLDTQLGDIPTVSEFNARTLLAADYFDPAADTVANVTLVATTTTNTDMRGTDGANTTTPPTAAAISDAVWDEATSGHTGAGTFGRLLGTTWATLFAGITSLADWLGALAGKTADTTTRTEINATTAGATYNETTDSMEAIRDRGDAAWVTGGGGGGGGARSITVTVDDGTDPLESATVRYTKGAETYVQTTDASGNASFSLDDGTWTVAITLPGYTFNATTLVVSADATPTYSMTASGLSVPSSPRIRARLLVLDAATKLGQASTDLTIVEVGAASSDGYASEVESRTVTTDANGLAEWYALPGEDYQVTGPGGTTYTIKIPSGATDPHSLTSILV